ncbi:hypothetical protein [Psychrobacter sp. JB385]|uniref:hypothetical protein n=1 Tax=Psychrobacter sp. JB385 TaxID=1434841 RepID=UPI000B363271|nr:hypothetical protein [Psychrobacter sp. JB385]
MNESKTYRVKADLVKKAKEKQMKYVIDRKEVVDEAEVINALILKGLEVIKNEDIEKYLNLRMDGKIK